MASTPAGYGDPSGPADRRYGPVVARRDEIIAFCDRLLEVESFGDWGPNGLQVPGREEVGRVSTAVSAHLASIEAAVADGSDLLLVHHGLFWDFHPRALTEAMAARLKTALDAGLSIAGYHLPLDAHPEIGNNALLISQLGFEPESGLLGEAKGSVIGMVGRHEEGIGIDELISGLTGELGQEPLVFANGPEVVRSIGVVTGAGASDVGKAIELGLDAFITGEPAEHVMADSAEGGLHFIAAGHYATERAGIRRLGELVSAEFGVETDFIEIPNPV
jgi:dinuclear metal center YbgI/SA1388 family protein